MPPPVPAELAPANVPNSAPETTAGRQIVTGKTFLSARWHALAMLNYVVDPDVLQPLAPRGTTLDLDHGRAYVSVVGFLFLDTRVLGIPIPFHRNFEEVNLRFYVQREVGGEVRRAVCFVKEIVPRWAIAATARWTYNEPYVTLPMRHGIYGPIREHVGRLGARPSWRSAPGLLPDQVSYSWRFGSRWNCLRLRHEGQPQPMGEGSHEQFIADHFWGYCTQRDGGTVEYRVLHPPWRIWRGVDAELDCDAGAFYGPKLGRYLNGPPASAFLADGSEVHVLQPARIA